MVVVAGTKVPIFYRFCAVLANLNPITVACGLLRGAARAVRERPHHPPSMPCPRRGGTLADDGTTGTDPGYACAVTRGQVTSRTVGANGLAFGVLEAGSGPLALCLHGFPDSAHTWRHLLPALAGAGFHAVAPFMRGYAPTEVPEDGCYATGALTADVLALHDALDGDADAVLIGHDWGAAAAYGAAAFAPERWRRLVTLAVPPRALDMRVFTDYDQLKRFFYFFAFQTPLAEQLVSADGMAFIDRLWADWAPGYDATEDLGHAKAALRDDANVAAAIGYYRAIFQPGGSGRYELEGQASQRQAPQPSLYLHGDADACVGIDLVRDVERHLAPQSRMTVVEHTGHFLHLERPAEVNEHILGWVAS
jgi:pimeloyl-ACP methyl ester carboxylesterase